MKCKRCGSENIVKNGSRRGKPCFLCKNCKHQFTSEKIIPDKYNDYDRYIAKFLERKYRYNKSVHPFIHRPLTIKTIAKILNVNYTTVHYWIIGNIPQIDIKGLIDYIKHRENGKDILGLMFPDKVKYQASEKLLEIVKRK